MHLHRLQAALPARACPLSGPGCRRRPAGAHLDISFNWRPLHRDEIELFEGFNPHRLPGHTPALLGLRVDLANAGTLLLTSDQCHLRDNCEKPRPLGWLLRNHAAWWRSYRVDGGPARGHARVGHDAAMLDERKRERFYD